MKVLVVDDCLSIRTLMKRYLIEWGFEPLTAGSGPEALSMIRESGLPRLIVVDWVMPEMQGPEFIQEVPT